MALVQGSVDLSRADESEDTLVCIATLYHNVKTVNHLLNPGIDVSTKDSDGYTALHSLAAWHES